MVKEKMSQLTVQLPDWVCKRAEQLAANDGVTVDQFVATAVVEKISVIGKTGYIAQRAAKANEEAFVRVLAMVPQGDPDEPWDKLP